MLVPRGRGRCVTPTSTIDLRCCRALDKISAFTKKPLVSVGQRLNNFAPKDLKGAIAVAHASAEKRANE